MIYFSELKRQRTIVYIVPADEIAVFVRGELASNNRVKTFLWKESKILFPMANLSELELASGQSPPPGEGWVKEIVAIGKSQVTITGGKVIAYEQSRIVGKERAHIKLFDQSIGFAFSGAHLFPHAQTTAIAVEGVVVPFQDTPNCFISPKSLIQEGRPHHPFDGTQAGFESAWRSAFPTADPPVWPI